MSDNYLTLVFRDWPKQMKNPLFGKTEFGECVTMARGDCAAQLDEIHAAIQYAVEQADIEWLELWVDGEAEQRGELMAWIENNNEADKP